MEWVIERPRKREPNAAAFNVTIESHRQNIKRKLQLDGHAALIKYAVERATYPESGTDRSSAQPLGRTSQALSRRGDGARLND
jgi:hypothetical protein